MADRIPMPCGEPNGSHLTVPPDAVNGAPGLTVRIGYAAKSKLDALQAVAALLIESGWIEPAYGESIRLREAQADTYLAHGIAIPHGRTEERNLIRQTGIAVLQIPGGIDWGHGHRVNLAIGIAARNDEHLPLLAALTELLDQPSVAQGLAVTSDPQEIVDLLRAPAQLVGATHAGSPPAAAESVEIRWPSGGGLHARPATRLAECARRFESHVQISVGSRSVDAKSMAALLKLGAAQGTVLRITARGRDAAAALAAIRAAAAETIEESAAAAPLAQRWTPPDECGSLVGCPASPGFAVGPTRRRTSVPPPVLDRSDGARVEIAKFDRALQQAAAELRQLEHAIARRADAEPAAIFVAHRALLGEAEVRAEVAAAIAAGHSAAWSWQRAYEARAAELGALADDRIAARGADWIDVGRRVLRLLVGSDQPREDTDLEPAILIADDLMPSEVAALDPAKLLGICTAGGGPTGHMAILARSLGIVAVVGAGPALSACRIGAAAILDGHSGRFYPDPTPDALASARRHGSALERAHASVAAERFKPAVMSDGHRVEVAANIGAVPDAAKAIEAGGEGVGLVRTEFLFLGRREAPSEDEQFEAYRDMALALGGLPLVIRTLDIGGDKPVPFVPSEPESNPFLGVRGLRLSLRHPELFRTQLRAIYRAALSGNVKVMFPMVTTLEDLRAAKTLAAEVQAELGAPPVDIGLMVELPAVALMAREFARETDFLSIGTNDLTQYTLAIDREHASLGEQADALHPAVLRLIDQTVRGAAAAPCWIGVCGGLASEPRGAIILAGLGVHELSVDIPQVGAVKAALRGVSFEESQSLAGQALACGTAAEVRRLPLRGPRS